MIYKFYYLNDTGGEVELSSYAKKINIEHSGINQESFEPITSQLSVDLRGNFTNLFEKQRVVRVKENNTVIFEGLTSIQSLDVRVVGIETYTSIKALDYTQKLKETKIPEQVFEGKTFSQILTTLLTYANLQNNIDIGTINSYYSFAYFKGGDLYTAVLQLFNSVGAVFDFTTGKIKEVYIAKDSYTSTKTIDKSYFTEIKNFTEDKKNVEVTGYDLVKTINDLIHINTTKDNPPADDKSECYIPIVSNFHYPIDGSKFSFDIQDENLLYIYDNTFVAEIDNSNIAVVDFTKAKKNIKYRLRNNANSTQILRKCRIKATTLKIEKEYVKSGFVNDNNLDNKIIIADNYFLDEDKADEFCKRLTQKIKARKYFVSVETDYDNTLQIGQCITFVDTKAGLNGLFEIQNITKDITPTKTTMKIDLVNVEATTITQSTIQIKPTQSQNTTQTQSIIDATTSNVLQILSPANTDGINSGGWTNIPANVTLKDIRIRGNLVIITVNKQENLSNFWRYEYKIKRQSEAWGEVQYSYFDTWSFIVQYFTDSNNKKIDTNFQIAIRRVTRANVASDWVILPGDTTYYTALAKISSLSNNFGDIWADSLLLNNYNYFFPQTLKVGGATNSMEYVSGNLQLANGNLQVMNGNIIQTDASGSITLGSEFNIQNCFRINKQGFLPNLIKRATGDKYIFYQTFTFSAPTDRDMLLNLNGIRGNLTYETIELEFVGWEQFPPSIDRFTIQIFPSGFIDIKEEDAEVIVIREVTINGQNIIIRFADEYKQRFGNSFTYGWWYLHLRVTTYNVNAHPSFTVTTAPNKIDSVFNRKIANRSRQVSFSIGVPSVYYLPRVGVTYYAFANISGGTNYILPVQLPVNLAYFDFQFKRDWEPTLYYIAIVNTNNQILISRSSNQNLYGWGGGGVLSGSGIENAFRYRFHLFGEAVIIFSYSSSSFYLAFWANADCFVSVSLTPKVL